MCRDDAKHLPVVFMAAFCKSSISRLTKHQRWAGTANHAPLPAPVDAAVALKINRDGLGRDLREQKFTRQGFVQLKFAEISGEDEQDRRS